MGLALGNSITLIGHQAQGVLSILVTPFGGPEEVLLCLPLAVRLVRFDARLHVFQVRCDQYEFGGQAGLCEYARDHAYQHEPEFLHAVLSVTAALDPRAAGLWVHVPHVLPGLIGARRGTLSPPSR